MIAALIVAATSACAPAAELGGDPDVVARLVPALATRGLATPRPGCPATRVEVTEVAGGIRVEARDALGRVRVRELRDEAAAPAVIEGLLRTGLDVTIAPPVAAPAPPPDPVPLRAVLSAVAGLDESGSVSTGVRASLERRLGALPALLTARWTFTPSVRTDLPPAHRQDLELGLGARHVLDAGGVGIAPGLALGAGATWTARSEPGCGPICGTPVVRDDASALALSPRATAFVEITSRLDAELEGRAVVEVTASPLATGPRVPAWARALPAGERERVALPADPRVIVRAGLGLAWGRW